mmetsp:Transcript_75263/g.133040  ORF Transcript_75263/g.133040 Transcript_75263/m.133040 type:complete len:115 (-) Transcript_75263:187-531(-)
MQGLGSALFSSHVPLVRTPNTQAPSEIWQAGYLFNNLFCLNPPENFEVHTAHSPSQVNAFHFKSTSLPQHRLIAGHIDDHDEYNGYKIMHLQAEPSPSIVCNEVPQWGQPHKLS